MSSFCFISSSNKRDKCSTSQVQFVDVIHHTLSTYLLLAPKGNIGMCETKWYMKVRKRGGIACIEDFPHPTLETLYISSLLTLQLFMVIVYLRKLSLREMNCVLGQVPWERDYEMEVCSREVYQGADTGLMPAGSEGSRLGGRGTWAIRQL